MYRFAFLIALAAGCGDNLQAMGGGGDDGGGDDTPETCSTELATSDLAGGSYDGRFTIPGFTGFDGHAPTVYDFARDTDGSIVVAGEFQYLGDKRVEPLLRYRNGAWGPARTTWELAPPGAGFSAIAIDDTGRTALATYDDFGPRSGQIWLDDGTGLRAIGNFNGLVRRLAWYQGKLWAAGFMEVAAAAPAAPIAGLAVWNGTAWTTPPVGKVTGYVYELEHDGANLLVGGSFTGIGGTAAKNVASFNGTAWTALSFPNTAIYALARDANGVLYAGGTFGDQFGATGGIARRNGNTWQLLGGGLQNRFIVGVATDLAVHAGSLYVTGCFHSAGGDEGDPGAVVAQGVARYDGAWHSLDDGTQGAIAPWVQPLACGDEGDGSVFDVSNQRLFSDGAKIYLGGSFAGVGGVLSQAIAAYDGTSWTAQGPSGLGLGGNIDRVAASDTCDIYAYGELVTHAGGKRNDSRVLHFTGEAWESIDDSAIPADAACTAFAVSHGGTAVVGCMIFPATGDPVGRIYKVAQGALVQAVDGLPLVQAVAFDADDTLWIGGATLEGGGFLARSDLATATVVDDTFDAPVSHVDPASSTDVIVAGTFTKIGSLDAARIARRTNDVWTALGDGLPGMPTALAHDATHVYASTFDDGSGAGGYLLGAFDGTAWTERASAAANLTPSPDFNFNAIRVVGSALVAVGSAELDDDTGRGALVLQGGRFTALGGGVHAVALSDLAITSDAIWVAGIIAEAGSSANLRSSVGVARYAITR